MSDLKSILKFNGENGMKPSAEARRYVYKCIDAMLESAENDEDHGLLFGAVEMEADLRRLRLAVKKVRKEMQRKAASRSNSHEPLTTAT